MSGSHRIGVIGGGIVGLATARRLQHLRPDATVTVIEKEARVAAHQTGRNSGVVHAGLYYSPGSLKARLCRDGAGLLKDFCIQRGIAYEECGKLVVARGDIARARLRDIQQRATANGVEGLRWLEASELQDVEPHVVGVAALHSPRTAIVDFGAVSRALADELGAAGGAVELGHEVTAIETRGNEIAVRSREGASWTFDRLVTCAGLQADRVARMAGDAADPMIVPFRGEYLQLAEPRRHLVRGLIYPVPDPSLPFLGVHFTRRVDGGVDVGPNAVLAFSREGYRRRDVRVADLADTLRWRGFRRLARRHWRHALREAQGSLVRRAFLREAKAFLPMLRPGDVVPATAGVRAQAVGLDGTLVDDFRISRLGRVDAVRNAPSPAATSSLAIAEHLADLALGDA